VKVLQGDLLILGSDGVFDNLFDTEILDIVKDFITSNPKTKLSAQKLSKAIVNAAKNK
jgi:serine/threonine protein phosphatase PrpC